MDVVVDERRKDMRRRTERTVNARETMDEALRVDPE
jgi:hypothetical protein